MPKTIPNGFLIAFDGIDGVGKTTQLQMSKAELESAGYTVMVKRNLGGTPIGDALGEIMLQPLPRPPLTDVYISAAIQAALIESIGAERAKGSIILLDRSPLSLVAYGVFGSGADAEVGWQLANSGMQELRPDLVIVYNAPLEVARQRLSRTGKHPDYFESKPPDFFERVARGYHEAAERYKATTIDATPSPNSVFASTNQVVREALAAQAEG
ncbi:MAG TPA: dTMP kinase [Candidatus Saccharimonadales bacterium]|jgi:dTMP kinase|nr:dTMP kinase [Candidatus Saccharimonadales bacterium]